MATTVSAEVSLYVLREPSLTVALERFLAALRSEGLEVRPGNMSTLIHGEAEEVFRALSAAFCEVAPGHDVVLRATVSNACPADAAAGVALAEDTTT